MSSKKQPKSVSRNGRSSNSTPSDTPRRKTFARPKTPTRGYNTPDKKTASKDLNHSNKSLSHQSSMDANLGVFEDLSAEEIEEDIVVEDDDKHVSEDHAIDKSGENEYTISPDDRLMPRPRSRNSILNEMEVDDCIGNQVHGTDSRLEEKTMQFSRSSTPAEDNPNHSSGDEKVERANLNPNDRNTLSKNSSDIDSLLKQTRYVATHKKKPNYQFPNTRNSVEGEEWRSASQTSSVAQKLMVLEQLGEIAEGYGQSVRTGTESQMDSEFSAGVQRGNLKPNDKRKVSYNGMYSKKGQAFNKKASINKPKVGTRNTPSRTLKLNNQPQPSRSSIREAYAHHDLEAFNDSRDLWRPDVDLFLLKEPLFRKLFSWSDVQLEEFAKSGLFCEGELADLQRGPSVKARYQTLLEALAAGEGWDGLGTLALHLTGPGNTELGEELLAEVDVATGTLPETREYSEKMLDALETESKKVVHIRFGVTTRLTENDKAFVTRVLATRSLLIRHLYKTRTDKTMSLVRKAGYRGKDLKVLIERLAGRVTEYVLENNIESARESRGESDGPKTELAGGVDDVCGHVEALIGHVIGLRSEKQVVCGDVLQITDRPDEHVDLEEETEQLLLRLIEQKHELGGQAGEVDEDIARLEGDLQREQQVIDKLHKYRGTEHQRLMVDLPKNEQHLLVLESELEELRRALAEQQDGLDEERDKLEMLQKGNRMNDIYRLSDGVRKPRVTTYAATGGSRGKGARESTGRSLPTADDHDVTRAIGHGAYFKHGLYKRKPPRSAEMVADIDLL